MQAIRYYTTDAQKSSYKGVRYDRYKRKWLAKIYINGKQKYITCWTESEAIENRKKFESIPNITEKDAQKIREELRESR